MNYKTNHLNEHEIFLYKKNNTRKILIIYLYQKYVRLLLIHNWSLHTKFQLNTTNNVAYRACIAERKDEKKQS